MYSSYETLLVDGRPDGIVTVTLNRPDRANSMTRAMFEEFSTLARELSDGGILVLDAPVTGGRAAAVAGTLGESPRA